MLIKKYLPMIFTILLLLFAGIIAITQEAPDADVPNISDRRGNVQGEDGEEENEFEDMPPEWTPPGLARWFRSNAGGMTLEETPSRLAALRNNYALLVYYAPPYELDTRLQQFYQDSYIIELRVLYERRRESRTQWLFVDETGTTRLNAVFKLPSIGSLDGEAFDEQPLIGDYQTDTEADSEYATEEIPAGETTAVEVEMEAAAAPDEPAAPAVPAIPDMLSVSAGDDPVSVGFIELFNEQSQIIEDRRLYDDDSEIHILYAYNRNTLIRAETHRWTSDTGYVRMYTDNYRYNRSASLRYVERRYHEGAAIAPAADEEEPVRLTFPHRVLDAAANMEFIGDKLFLNFDFFGGYYIEEGYRMMYETDNRGKVLTQTMLNQEDEVVWMVKNTWSGERISVSVRTEGENVKRIEYEYDSAGNKIVQRDINNGVLERRIITNGDKETEELYMNGVVVLRAYWENGRKLNEERVR